MSSTEGAAGAGAGAAFGDATWRVTGDDGGGGRPSLRRLLSWYSDSRIIPKSDICFRSFSSIADKRAKLSSINHLSYNGSVVCDDSTA
jgi:hypothetical protein